MRKFKIFLLIVLGTIDLILLAVSIAYLIMGIQAPNSLGGREIFFTGSYLLFLVYFLIFIMVTILFIISIRKLKRNNK